MPEEIVPNTEPIQTTSLLTPRNMVICFSLILILSAFFTYIQYSNINKNSLPATAINPTITKAPTPITSTPSSDPLVTEEVSDQLPEGWVYKSDGRCDIQIPVPPQKEPYTHPLDPERPTNPSSLTDDVGSGRYWDYGRGVFWPDLLGLLPNGEENYQQVAITYASPEEASDYTSAAVVVSCVPNTKQYNDTQALSALKESIYDYNLNSGDKGMRPSTYEITSEVETTRWGVNVIDIDLKESNSVYMFFTTPNYIYEIRSIGESTDSFVRETSDKILMNLKLN